MRFRELLLEYNHDITLAKYGPALAAHIKNEAKTSLYAKGLMSNHFVSEEFMYDVILGIIEKKVPHKFITWAIKTYLNGGINYFEDMDKVGSYVQQHMDLRKSGYFKRNPEANMKYGDIGRFKTLSDLGTFLMSVEKADAISNSEKDRQHETQLITSKQAEIVYDDANYKVIVPHTQEASIWFGRSTQWCTAATKSENLFDHYAEEGPLYIILEKKTNSRWQLHLESAQFMDETDTEVSFDLLNKFPYSKFLLPGKLSTKAIGQLVKFFKLDSGFFTSILKPLNKVDLCNVLGFTGSQYNTPAYNIMKGCISRIMSSGESHIDENDTETLYFDDGVDMMMYIMVHRIAGIDHLHRANFFNQPLQGRHDIGTLLETHKTSGAIIHKNNEYLLIGTDQYISTAYMAFSNLSYGETSLNELWAFADELKRRIRISSDILDSEETDDEYRTEAQWTHNEFIDAFHVTLAGIEYLRNTK